ncbi:hypothetical protein, partial [Streptococcus pneumoniae]|uniref:hypothetical protein n=1 Tax=Streptococcus pneumoniae TaxID=1313 RepID=UPI001D11E852
LRQGFWMVFRLGVNNWGTIYHNGQRASCQEITVILVKKEAEKFHFLLLFYRIYFSFSELLTSAFLADLI